MPLEYDPEWLSLAGPKLKLQGEILPVGDVETRRSRYAQLFAGHSFTLPEDIELQVHKVAASGGYQVSIYHLSKKGAPLSSGSTPAVLHIHGGGFISVHAGDVLPTLVPFVWHSGIPIFSVDYRWAPESPFPTPVEDCWSGLQFIHSRAESFGVDTSRIAIMGESAGGGLAASLALLARDRQLSPPLAKQILLYPMLDDRTETDHTGGLAVFHVNDIVTGWSAYLGETYRTDQVSPFASAARAESVVGLPPLYMDVGQLDVFLPEDVAYAQRFLAAGIQTELHVYPGVIHAFQRWSPDSHVVKQAWVNRMRAISTL
ncbi:hypothetical protein NW767_011928 [Fusarium falciforme]|nr:hypothetical protein NW767_011928 [Fusarium falciforme]